MTGGVTARRSSADPATTDPDGDGRGSESPGRADDDRPDPPDLRLVPIALTAWAGCLLVPPDGAPALSIVVTAAGAVAVLLGLAARRPRWRAGLVAAVAGLLVGLLVAGLHAAQRAADPIRIAAAGGGSASVSGTVDGYPRPVASRFADPAAEPTAGPASGSGAVGDEQRWAVTITARTGRVSGVDWAELDSPITIYGRGPTWATLLPGQALSVSGRLASPPRADLAPTLTARRDARPENAPPWWYRAAGAVRSTLRAQASALPPDPAGLVPGLVVGDTGGIDERLDADAKTTGLTHLLAVSGSHFALLCGLAVVLLGAAGPRAAALGGLAVLIALVVLVGPEPSVLRAAVMGLVTVVALLSGRRRAGVPALAGAVLLLLLVAPDLARSAGFALSVLATGALVLVAPWWVSALHRRGVPRGWAQLLCIPVAAQLATLPVIVAISGSISLVGVLANVLVAPVVAPALIVGMAAALCGPWWPSAAQVLVGVAGWLLDWVATVAHALARWPLAALPWPATPAGVTVLVVLLLGAVAALRRRRPRHLVLAALVGVLAVVLPVKVVGVGWPPPGWLLVACEVGQGDAMVLSTGEPGTAVVVDTGPDPVVLDACLDRLGVTTVAVLVLTHLHADHVAGLTGAMDGRLVGPVLTGPGRDPAGTWHAIESAARDAGSTVSTPPVGATYRVGALTLTVLGPAAEFHGTESDPNNDSLVVRADIDGRRMLFTGDIEPPAQQALLRSPEALRADVLKVPHHGSARTLDRFLRAVGADIAVIGVGLDNDYGHPSPKLLAALASAGTGTVLRTDLDGDAAVVVDPDDAALATRVRGPDGVVTTVSVRE